MGIIPPVFCSNFPDDFLSSNEYQAPLPVGPLFPGLRINFEGKHQFSYLHSAEFKTCPESLDGDSELSDCSETSAGSNDTALEWTQPVKHGRNTSFGHVKLWQVPKKGTAREKDMLPHVDVSEIESIDTDRKVDNPFKVKICLAPWVELHKGDSAHGRKHNTPKKDHITWDLKVLKDFKQEPTRSIPGQPRTSPKDKFKKKWNFLQCNPTSWTSMHEFLARLEDCPYDLIVIQELSRDAEQIEYMQSQANKMGFHCEINPSVNTEGGGRSAGVAILSPWQFSLAEHVVLEKSKNFDGRFIIRHWYGLLKGGLLVGSLYLHCGGWGNNLNRLLMEDVAHTLVSIGRPFLIGADFQMSPEEMHDTGWPASLRARVISTGVHTYESGEHKSELDYFLVSNSIADLFEECNTVDTEVIKKHLPVITSASGDCRDREVSTICKPKRMPLVLPKGPCPPPPSWEAFDDIQNNGVHTADTLDTLYEILRKNVAIELCDVLQIGDTHDPEDYTKRF